MTKNIIGCFVFRDEGDGCLTSKWMNDSPESPFTEGCKILDREKRQFGKFYGTYETVWVEDDNKHAKAHLLIEKNPKNPKTYKLRWYKPWKKEDIIFEGIGMLFEDKLVGSYWN